MILKFLPAALLAIGLSACSSSGGYDRGYAGSSDGHCQDCGVVQRIESYQGERHSSGAGAVAGAVIGGALGNQVGKGDGKTAATVAGAVLGGIAGNEIEKNRNQTWYDVSIRMNDGRTVVVSQNGLNGIREGSRVVIRDGNAYLD